MRSEKLMARNSLFLLSASVFNLTISVFTTSVIARSIGPEYFGKYTFGLAYVVLFSVLANFGLESLFVREAARDRENLGKLISDILAIKCLLAAFTVLVLIGFAHLMGYDESTITVIKILALGLFFQIASDIITAVYRSLEQLHVISASQVCFRVLTAIIIFLSVYTGIGFWGIVCSYTIGRVVVFFFLFAHYRRNVGIRGYGIKIRNWPDLVRRGLPFYFSAIFTMLYMKITVLFLAETHGEHEVGIYMAAAVLVESLLFLPNTFSMILFSAFSRIYGTSLEALKKAFIRSMKYIVILITAVATGTALISGRLIALIYGEEFHQAPMVLCILICFWALAFLSQNMSNLLFAIHQEKSQVKIMGTTCLANVLLNLLLVPRMGAVGSATAFLLSELLAVLLILDALRSRNLKWAAGSWMARIVPALAVMAMVVVSARELNLALTVVLGALAYVVALLVLQIFDREDCGYFLGIFRKDVPSGFIEKTS